MYYTKKYFRQVSTCLCRLICNRHPDPQSHTMPDPVSSYHFLSMFEVTDTCETSKEGKSPYPPHTVPPVVPAFSAELPLYTTTSISLEVIWDSLTSLLLWFPTYSTGCVRVFSVYVVLLLKGD